MITWTDHLHSDKCKSGIKFHINHRGPLFQVLDNICFISHRKLSFSMLSLASGNPNSRPLCHMCITKLKTFSLFGRKRQMGLDKFLCSVSGLHSVYMNVETPLYVFIFSPPLHVKQTRPYTEKKR